VAEQNDNTGKKSKSNAKDVSILEGAKTIVSVTPAKVELPKNVLAALRKLVGSEDGSDGDDTKEKDKPVVTNHSLLLADGSKIDYTATTGRIALKEEDGTEKARIFFAAYTRDDIGNINDRPITFCFNGGPGSSSVWLHMGAFGPKRVAVPDDATQAELPYRTIDNAYSTLDVSDLVFIDPVSTGFSRAAKEEDAGEFHEVSKDVESVGDFIRLYCTQNKRWASPKFLAGESYGTTRAAGLSGYLQNRHGLYLSGIVLVSSVLNFQTLAFDDGNDLPFILFLPTYATTSRYHGQLADSLQNRSVADLAREVEQFAVGKYASALMQGTRLSENERSRIAAQLVRYTGLPKHIIEECDLRIAWDTYCDELLRHERQCVGRLDSRYKSFGKWATSEQWLLDPSYSATLGPYSGAFNHYIRAELGYENDIPYEIISERVHPWSYAKTASNKYLDVAETLRTAMTRNKRLRVLVTNGFYDLATPFAATEYTFSHLSWDAQLTERISMTYYEAGHMMYLHEPSLAALKNDVSRFLTGH